MRISLIGDKDEYRCLLSAWLPYRHTNEEVGQDTAALSGNVMSELLAQIQMHNGVGAADHAVGAWHLLEPCDSALRRIRMP